MLWTTGSRWSAGLGSDRCDRRSAVYLAEDCVLPPEVLPPPFPPLKCYLEVLP